MRQHWRDHLKNGRVTAISHFWGLQKKLVKNVTLKPSTPKQQREGHQEYSIAAYNAGRANAQLHLTRDLQLQVDPSSANRICLETDPSKTHHGPPPPSTHRLDSREQISRKPEFTRDQVKTGKPCSIFQMVCLWAELRCGTCQSKSHIHQLWQTQQSQSSDIDRAVKIGYVILADAVRAIQCNGWSCQRKIERPKSCNHERGAKCCNHLDKSFFHMSKLLQKLSLSSLVHFETNKKLNVKRTNYSKGRKSVETPKIFITFY